MRWFLLLFLFMTTAWMSVGCGSKNAASNPTSSGPAATPTPIFNYPYFASMGTAGTSGTNGEFEYPIGIAIGDGYFAVADNLNNNVQVFNNLGTYLYHLPVNQPNGIAIALDADQNVELYAASWPGTIVSYLLGPTNYSDGYEWICSGNLVNASDVKVRSNGDLVVTDDGSDKVYITSWLNDTVLATSHGVTFSSLAGVAVASDGTYFATDFDASRVVHLDSNLNALGSFTGSAWTIPLHGPAGIVEDSQHDLILADAFNARVVRTDHSGNYLEEIGHGVFSSPQYLALDAAGDVFVTDENNYNVTEFTPQQ